MTLARCEQLRYSETYETSDPPHSKISAAQPFSYRSGSITPAPLMGYVTRWPLGRSGSRVSTLRCQSSITGAEVSHDNSLDIRELTGLVVCGDENLAIGQSIQVREHIVGKALSTSVRI